MLLKMNAEGAILVAFQTPTSAPSSICTICREGLNDASKMSTTSCGHQFHAECLQTWKEKASIPCPNCRTNLSPAKVPKSSGPSSPPSLLQPPSWACWEFQCTLCTFMCSSAYKCSCCWSDPSPENYPNPGVVTSQPQASTRI